MSNTPTDFEAQKNAEEPKRATRQSVFGRSKSYSANGKQKVFALVDCNNFFVSCERLFRPALKNTPVAVLSNNDGCLIARSNEVKALGVPMGAPHFKYRDLLEAHKTTIFSANFQLYGDISERVSQTLMQFSPNIEIYSIDESFMQIENLPISDYDQWARDVAREVEQQVGIPVSVGVGPSKTLAKAAVERVKKTPEMKGGFSVAGSKEAQVETLKWLPLGDVWGIGRRRAETLGRVGLKSAYDVTGLTDEWILKNMTITGLRTVRELRGESCIPLDMFEDDNHQKSLSVTRSFGRAVKSHSEVEAAVASFCARAAQRLRRKEQITWRGSVFIRRRLPDRRKQFIYADFTMPIPTSFTGDIIRAATSALSDIYDPDFSYDKAGVVLTSLLGEDDQQLSLFGGEDQASTIGNRLALMKAVDQLSLRYGKSAVVYAAEGVKQKGEWKSRQERMGPCYTTKWAEIPSVRV